MPSKAEKTRFLEKLPLFQGVPAGLIAELAGRLERCTFQAGEALFREGDPGDSLYLLQSGRVKVVSRKVHGEELVLNELEPGEFFGEMALLDEVPRSAGVVALTRVSVLKLTRDDFFEVLSREPSVALAVLRSLSARLRFAARYIQKAIEWGQHVAAGNYSQAMGEIETVQSGVVDEIQSDEARINILISTFFQLVQGVQAREETLKQQLQALRIEIDRVKEAQEVAKIVETDYFRELQKKAKRLRKDPRGSEEEDAG